MLQSRNQTAQGQNLKLRTFVAKHGFFCNQDGVRRRQRNVGRKNKLAQEKNNNGKIIFWHKNIFLVGFEANFIFS